MEFNNSVKLKGNVTRTIDWEIDWEKANPTTPSEVMVASVLQHIIAFEKDIDHDNEFTCLFMESAVGSFLIERLVPTAGSIIRVEGRSQEGARIWRMVNAEQLAFTILAKPKEEEEEEQNPIGFVIFNDLKERKVLPPLAEDGSDAVTAEKK